MTWPIVKLDAAQAAKLSEWMSAHTPVYSGAIGGRYTFECTPTGLGQVLKVKDEVTKTEIDLSDYESW